jgi:sugar phosphate isomerase/epimerase
VTFQLDVGWATIGGEDPVALIEDFGKRIELLHVKDVADLASRTQTTVGQGIIDWAGVFAASQGKVKQYVIEQDPPVEPFSFAAESFEYVDCLVF